MLKKISSILLFSIVIHASLFAQVSKNDNEYLLIHCVFKEMPEFHTKGKMPEVNQNDINKLSEPLKALAAYYSALGGSNCDFHNDGEVCELTTALGLGNQGSDKHISILQKWFRNDTIVAAMIEQNCFLSISGSNNFSTYSYLKFKQSGDTIQVNYEIGYYNTGNSKSRKAREIAVLHNDHIEFIKRRINF